MGKREPRTSGRVRVLAVAFLLLALVPAAWGQANDTEENVQRETVHLDITGHDSAGQYWFEVEGLKGRNPTIALPAGVDVVVNFAVSDPAQVEHNVHFAPPIGQKTEVIPPGASRTLTFSVPEGAEGEFEYWCDPHQAVGMRGTLLLGEVPPDPQGDEEGGEETPGFGAAVAVAAVGAAVVIVRRR